MRSQTAISLAALTLFQEKGTLIGYRDDLVGRVQELRYGGVDVSNIRVLPTPSGLSSAEVSELIGRLAARGYIVQESPIRLTSDGLRLLKDHLRRAYEDSHEEIVSAAAVLNISEEELEKMLRPADEDTVVAA